MNPLHILIAEAADYSPEALATYRALGEVRAEPAGSRARLLELVPWADVLVVRLRHKLDREVFDAAPRLKAVVTPTTGLDHIDTAEAARRGIAVLALKGETDFLRTIPATAELTWGLLLALVRRLPAACASVRDGRWQRDAFRGRDLRGRTLGIIGYGRVGAMVAGYGTAFGLRVLVHDLQPVAAPAGLEWCDLDDLLARADIVSVHVPLLPATIHLLGAPQFAQMKPGAILLNTSRGEVLDEAALRAALESGHLAGAALDVLSGERGDDSAWMEGHPLVRHARTHENLLITPHIGGATLDSMQMTEAFMARKLAHHLGVGTNQEATP